MKDGYSCISEEPRASARGFFYRKSHSTWGLSALKPPWPFIPALPSGAFWLFHIKVAIMMVINKRGAASYAYSVAQGGPDLFADDPQCRVSAAECSRHSILV
jgi:hypothetical protein